MVHTIYRGVCDQEGRCEVFVEDPEEGMGRLPMCLHLRNHSPTGFAWGYGGSGPAQLALALASHLLKDDDAALEVYQLFKWRLISRLPRDGWCYSGPELREILDELVAAIKLAKPAAPEGDGG